jgi:hypothetical protein
VVYDEKTQEREEVEMIRVRKSEDRGHADHGWLDTRHTFSFASYFDPAHMGFRDLRVINQDKVAPGRGFGAHSHRDMEIISYVIDGALEHKDSMGTSSVIKPGEVQRMTAGTGVTHSEYNHSSDEGVQFLQIWILPERDGLRPGYEQRDFSEALASGDLVLAASQDGRDGSVTVHQNVGLYVAKPSKGKILEHRLDPGRHAWVQLVAGKVDLNGTEMIAGDGAQISGERNLTLAVKENSELLVFDLA